MRRTQGSRSIPRRMGSCTSRSTVPSGSMRSMGADTMNLLAYVKTINFNIAD